LFFIVRRQFLFSHCLRQKFHDIFYRNATGENITRTVFDTGEDIDKALKEAA
jgi:hypothetical protein